MEAFVRYVVGEMSTIAHAPVAFVAATLIAGVLIWWMLDWRYSGIIANKDAELSLARNERDGYKNRINETQPKGELAGNPIEFATEKDSHVIPLGPNKFSVMFSKPMRATPTIRIIEPAVPPASVKFEYWSPLGFTIEFPAGTLVHQLRFTADAHAPHS